MNIIKTTLLKLWRYLVKYRILMLCFYVKYRVFTFFSSYLCTQRRHWRIGNISRSPGLPKRHEKSSVSATLSLSLSQCGERFGEGRIFFGSLLFEKKVNYSRGRLHFWGLQIK